MNKSKVFSFFRETNIPALRAWNQLNFARNLEETHGESMSERYFEKLTEPEKVNVLAVGARCHIKGEDFVRKEVAALSK
jgi:hypothetical protein